MKPFKNAIVYRLTREMEFEDLQVNLEGCEFGELGSQEMSRIGWVSPIKDADEDDGLLYFSRTGKILLTAKKEEKILPGQVVKRTVDERVKELESKLDKKINKAEKDRVKDEVIHTLLPNAFTKESETSLLIDSVNGVVVVDSSSNKRAEDVLALLRKSIGSLPIVPMQMETPVELTMTNWVNGGDLPYGLSLLDEVEMKATLEEGGVVRCKKQDLVSDEVSTHIEAGKRVTSLRLDVEDRVQLTLLDDFSMRKVKFSDILTGQNDDIDREDKVTRFIADFTLFSAEILSLVSKLSVSLGGEAK